MEIAAGNVGLMFVVSPIAELAASDEELIMTFMSNGNLTQVVEDVALYVPIAVRVTIAV